MAVWKLNQTRGKYTLFQTPGITHNYGLNKETFVMCMQIIM